MLAMRQGMSHIRVSVTGSSFSREVHSPMLMSDVFGSLLTGLLGGVVSGLLGVTSGGILVPLLILVLGRDQHSAQGLSLLAQVFPASLSGVRQYARHGHDVSWRWVGYLGAGFAVGGVLGALGAGGVADRALRWAFVAYLVLLMTLMEASRRRRARGSQAEATSSDAPAHWGALAAIGAAGGLSSGFLGIGGGLAITALMTAVLHLPQHRAQAFSLAVTALPLTLPAAWIYVQQGAGIPWVIVAGVVAGLWIGTLIGSQFANRIPEQNLRGLSFLFIGAMALYMAYRALM